MSPEVTETLTVRQKQEVNEFLQRNTDVFPELPRATILVKHDIITDPHVQVHHLESQKLIDRLYLRRSRQY